MEPTASATRARWSRWLQAWTLLSLPGVAVATVISSQATLLGLVLVVAPVGLVLAMVEHDRRSGTLGYDARAAARWHVRVALCAATLTVSTVAIGRSIPGWTFLVVVLAIATSPPATARWGRAWGRTPEPTLHPSASGKPSPLTPAGVAGEAREMSDAELCRAWRGSYWALREAPNAAITLAVVNERQCLLDELETRNPHAVTAWLASGARPAGGPEKFMDGSGGDQTSAA